MLLPQRYFTLDLGLQGFQNPKKNRTFNFVRGVY